MEIKIITSGVFLVNTYILYQKNSKQALIIDPGNDIEQIKEFIKQKKLQPQAIILTHGHYDHIEGCGEIQNYFKIPVYLHQEDLEIFQKIGQQATMFGQPHPTIKAKVTNNLLDQQTLEIADLSIKVYQTPGHSEGSVCLQIENILFSGDTLFAGGQGRTDLFNGNPQKMQESLNFLAKTFAPETKVYPGHGPATTIGQEF